MKALITGAPDAAPLLLEELDEELLEDDELLLDEDELLEEELLEEFEEDDPPEPPPPQAVSRITAAKLIHGERFLRFIPCVQHPARNQCNPAIARTPRFTVLSLTGLRDNGIYWLRGHGV